MIWLGLRAGHIRIDDRLRQSAIKLSAAGLALAAIVWLLAPILARAFAGLAAARRCHTGGLGAIGGTFYAGVVLAMFGRRWLAAFRGRAR